jgi:hypothetical protein
MTSLRMAFSWLVALCVSNARAEGPTSPRPVPSVCVILIGGIDSDPTPEQIAGTAPRGQGQSGMYQLAEDLAREGLSTEYFNWNGSRAGKIKDKPPLTAGIAQFIIDRHEKQPTEQLAIIANSWGGHTAWEVCEALAEPEIPIAVAVFLDPSSLGRAKTARPAQLPRNIQTARNYYTRNVFGWRELPHEERLVNVDLGDPQLGFLVTGGPKYDAAFDTKAHIAAEWDPRIHREITQQVLTVLKAETTPSVLRTAAGETAGQVK